MQLQSLILFLIIITFAVGAILVLLRKTPGSVSLRILVIIIAAWIIAYLFYRFLATPISLQVLRAVHYFSLTSAATSVYYISISYTNRAQWLNKSTITLFLLEPIVIQIFFWTEPLKRNFFAPGFWLGEQINLIYVLMILTGSIVLLADTLLNRPRIRFLRAGTMVLGVLFPLFGNTSTIFIRNFETNLLILIFSYCLAIVGFLYIKFSSSIIETTPLTREIVVEDMDDGWMVIDDHDNIIDLNSSAEKMVGLSRETIYGQPITQILTEWPKISKSSEGIQEMEMRRSVKSQSGWHYLNIRISQLRDKKNGKFGHLIVWRDITGRKLADDARQRARDELFVLLNSISSTASRSSNMEDFLSETSYQILYSFHSQAVAVFLTEEEDAGKQKLSLKTHFGLEPEYIKELNSNTATSNLYYWLTHNDENRPLTVDNFNDSTDFPLRLNNIGAVFGKSVV